MEWADLSRAQLCLLLVISLVPWKQLYEDGMVSSFVVA